MKQEKINILLVDRDVANLQTLSELLNTHDYAVRTALDGASALVMAKAIPPDLILLQANLPITQGNEVCHHLKTTNRTRDIPIIMLYAAETPSAEKAQGLQQGADDYLSAPFCKVEVLHRIKHNLQLRQLEQTKADQLQILNELTIQCEETEQTLEKVNAEVEHWIAERLAAIRASEAMFRYFLSRSNDGYVIVNEENGIQYANKQARIYLGLNEESPTPPPDFITLIKKQYHCEPEMAWEMWPKKTFIKGVAVDLYLVRPESNTATAFWLKVRMLDVPAGMDASSGRIIHLEDITEQTALQDELNKFHALIAHKLRTPLVPIYSGLQYILGHIQKLSTEELIYFLEEAKSGAERLYQEVEDIVQYLNAPNLIKGGNYFRLENFSACIQEIASNLEIQNLTINVDPTLHTSRIGISSQNLELILWELLENAKKFHPTNAPQVEVTLSHSGTKDIRLEVADNGLTLSPTQLIHMWLPYYQGDKFATGQVAGMGLGLSLVTMQVWGIGGMCRAHNREDGPGIVIEIQMPRLLEEEKLEEMQ